MSQRVADKTGQDYVLDLTIGCALRIQESTGVNILADTNFVTGATGGMHAALLELESDPLRLALVLEAACRPEYEARKITRNDFLARWDHPALTKAYASLVEAICDFFPDRAEKIRKVAETVASGRAKTDQANEAALEAGRKLLEGIDVAALVDEAINRAGAASSTRGTGSGKPPAS